MTCTQNQNISPILVIPCHLSLRRSSKSVICIFKVANLIGKHLSLKVASFREAEGVSSDFIANIFFDISI